MESENPIRRCERATPSCESPAGERSAHPGTFTQTANRLRSHADRPGTWDVLLDADHDARALVLELTLLARQSPKSSSRHRAQAVLAWKWDGLRVVAARTLCCWGDSASIDLVKAALWDLVVLPNRMAATWPISRALGPCLIDADLDWALQLFARAHCNNRSGLIGMFDAFTPAAVLARLPSLAPVLPTRSWQEDIDRITRRTQHRHRSGSAPWERWRNW